MTTDITGKCEWLAEHLLGCVFDKDPDGSFDYWTRGTNGPVIHPSEDLLTGNGALEIIEAMRERKQIIELTLETDSDNGDYALSRRWECCMFTPRENGNGRGFGESLPEAIINAAYAALQETVT